MERIEVFFKELYEKFNQRKIGDVVSQMTDNVIWANGMDGGFVKYKIRVHQVVHDLDGNLLADESVYHYFQLEDDKIVKFEIGERI